MCLVRPLVYRLVRGFEVLSKVTKASNDGGTVVLLPEPERGREESDCVYNINRRRMGLLSLLPLAVLSLPFFRFSLTLTGMWRSPDLSLYILPILNVFPSPLSSWHTFSEGQDPISNQDGS